MKRGFAAAVIAEAFVTLCIFLCSASASHITPPPDPNASCARAEYAASTAGHFSDDSASSLVVVAGDKTKRLNTSTQVAMGREVTVCVMGLYNWLYVQKNRPETLHLSIGGQVLSKMSLSTLAPPGQEYVNFTLHVEPDDTEDQKAWAAIVYSFRHSPQHTLTISIAHDTQVFESHAVTAIRTYPEYWFYLVVALIALLLVFIYLARKTTMLRATTGWTRSDAQSAPFSLGLVQMAVWFFLALAAYVYVCASTLQVHVPMGSMLGLLGISASTGLAAAAVDVRKRALAQASATTTQPPEGPSPGEGSRGFFLDILSDADGISFHRFQIAVWTVVLGVVFAWSVYRYMEIPVFDASLLTLMGISSGTYVGFKFPEASK